MDINFVKQRKLNETIEGHMLLNDTVLKVIHDNLDKYKNFKELYYAGVAEFNLLNYLISFFMNTTFSKNDF